MKGILIDTSSFIEAFLQRVSLPQLLLLGDEPIKPYTASTVVGELKKLSRIKSERGRAALFSLSLIKSGKVKVLKAVGPTDDVLIALALQHGFYILSQDSKLRRRARDIGLKAKSLKDGKLV
ncbi:MAG: hypothetical protein QW035_00475 [Candidatus Anstonellales archaeon]